MKQFFFSTKAFIGEEFTRKFFVERMKFWNWDLITNNSIQFRKVD